MKGKTKNFQPISIFTNVDFSTCVGPEYEGEEKREFLIKRPLKDFLWLFQISTSSLDTLFNRKHVSICSVMWREILFLFEMLQQDE